MFFSDYISRKDTMKYIIVLGIITTILWTVFALLHFKNTEAYVNDAESQQFETADTYIERTQREHKSDPEVQFRHELNDLKATIDSAIVDHASQPDQARQYLATLRTIVTKYSSSTYMPTNMYVFGSSLKYNQDLFKEFVRLLETEQDNNMANFRGFLKNRIVLFNNIFMSSPDNVPPYLMNLTYEQLQEMSLTSMAIGSAPTNLNHLFTMPATDFDSCVKHCKDHPICNSIYYTEKNKPSCYGHQTPFNTTNFTRWFKDDFGTTGKMDGKGDIVSKIRAHLNTIVVPMPGNTYASDPSYPYIPDMSDEQKEKHWLELKKVLDMYPLEDEDAGNPNSVFKRVSGVITNFLRSYHFHQDFYKYMIRKLEGEAETLPIAKSVLVFFKNHYSTLAMDDSKAAPEDPEYSAVVSMHIGASNADELLTRLSLKDVVFHSKATVASTAPRHIVGSLSECADICGADANCSSISMTRDACYPNPEAFAPGNNARVRIFADYESVSANFDRTSYADREPKTAHNSIGQLKTEGIPEAWIETGSKYTFHKPDLMASSTKDTVAECIAECKETDCLSLQYNTKTKQCGLGKLPIYTGFQDWDGNAYMSKLAEKKNIVAKGMQMPYFVMMSDLTDPMSSTIEKPTFTYTWVGPGKQKEYKMPALDEMTYFLLTGDTTTGNIRAVLSTYISPYKFTVPGFEVDSYTQVDYEVWCLKAKCKRAGLSAVPVITYQRTHDV